MNYRLLAVLLAFWGAAWLAFLAKAGEEKGKKSSGPPPLVVDKEEPLLLEEPEKDKENGSQGIAENQACFVCHVNYTEEPLVLVHAGEEISCVSCHGASFAHRNDENNTTPPDRMYPLEKIDASCTKCHEGHDVPAAKVVSLWLKRHAKKGNPHAIVCTDCHGNHRLKIRSVRWEKKTGKLILEKPGKSKMPPPSPAPQKAGPE